jgi:AcrR family transcriptional regulator
MSSSASPRTFSVDTEQTPVPDRHEALLRAAAELFAEKTYGATAVPEIAARAHVGTGTVYRHFESKAALANTLYRRCKTAMRDCMQSAHEGGGSHEQRFLRLWHNLFDMAAADPTALRFLELQHHDDYLDDESRRLTDETFAIAEAFIRDGQAAGAIGDGDPGVLISLVFGAFVGAFKESTAGRFVLREADVREAGPKVWGMIRA